MADELVSIIVPVYKTEAFLRSCVESIQKQTYQNLEILLIDDGSPDNCPALCDAFARQDSRIRVIHKENEGLGMARNTGLTEAKGQYLCFVDSDDVLFPEAVAYALGCMREHRPELVIFGMADIDQDGNMLKEYLPSGNQICYRGCEVINQLLPHHLYTPGGMGMSACTCLYSRDLIRRADWRFPSERQILSEDVYALLQLYAHISSAAVLPRALYGYRNNPHSLSRSYRRDRFAAIDSFYRESLALCREQNYPMVVEKRLGQLYLGYVLGAMKQEAACQLPAEAKRRIGDALKSETLRDILHQQRGTPMGLFRRLFFLAAQLRLSVLCLWMLKAKNRAKGGTS